MEKLNLLLVIIIGIIFSSCSSDSDNITNQDVIVWEWKQVKTIKIDIDGIETFEDLTQCEQQGRLTLNSDGTLDFLRYFEDDNNNCIEDDSFVNGSWNNNQSSYTFNFIFLDPSNSSNINITQTPIEVTFPNENKMLIKDLDNNSVNFEFSVAELIRIN